ncbi:MAG: HIRAN domain-containing protein [Candidatus Limousia pullorum]
MAKGFKKILTNLIKSSLSKSKAKPAPPRSPQPQPMQPMQQPNYYQPPMRPPVVSQPQPEKPAVRKINPKYKSFYKILDEYKLAYEYNENLCYIKDEYDDIAQYLGYDLSFKKEPENQYDDKAVAVYVKEFGKKIGYVYKGKIQDMINDWIDKDLPFTAYINDLPEKDGKKLIEYKIGFYKEYDKSVSKTFSLTRTGKKDFCDIPRVENLECCKAGESVEFSFDSDSETYVLSSAHGEIGELPKSANAYMDEGGENAVVIDKIYTDDNGKTKAKIRVYKI